MSETGATAPATPSSLALFVQALMTEGRAVIAASPLDDPADDAAQELAQLHAHSITEIAFDPPAYSDIAALWAARLFYHLCQFTVCRDIGEDRITAVCRMPCPAPRGPETDWSVDLTLRHLTRLFHLARHLSNADPLVAEMNQIAADWPLSSVGIAGLENLQTGSFITHPALGRLYADRIVSAGDASRLGDTYIDDLLRADLGLHHELAPAIATKLFQPV